MILRPAPAAGKEVLIRRGTCTRFTPGHKGESPAPGRECGAFWATGLGGVSRQRRGGQRMDGKVPCGPGGLK